MEEIRKQDEKEIVIARGTFNVPIIYIVVDIIILLDAVGYFIGCIALLAIDGATGGALILFIATVLFGVVGGMLLAFHLRLKDNLQCVITNQRIYGRNAGAFLGIRLKTYSYRLDRIDGVSMKFCRLGTLVINFSSGNDSQAVFGYGGVWGADISGFTSTQNALRIRCLENFSEMFEKASRLMMSVKNDTDLRVDLELRKLETENKKAYALIHMANGGSAESSDN